MKFARLSEVERRLRTQENMELRNKRAVREPSSFPRRTGQGREEEARARIGHHLSVFTTCFPSSLSGLLIRWRMFNLSRHVFALSMSILQVTRSFPRIFKLYNFSKNVYLVTSIHHPRFCEFTTCAPFLETFSAILSNFARGSGCLSISSLFIGFFQNFS